MWVGGGSCCEVQWICHLRGGRAQLPTGARPNRPPLPRPVGRSDGPGSWTEPRPVGSLHRRRVAQSPHHIRGPVLGSGLGGIQANRARLSGDLGGARASGGPRCPPRPTGEAGRAHMKQPNRRLDRVNPPSRAGWRTVHRDLGGMRVFLTPVWRRYTSSRSRPYLSAPAPALVVLTLSGRGRIPRVPL